MWFVGPQPIVPSLYGLVVCLFLFTSLALVATFIRLYTRAAMIQRLGWDDWFMTSTMLFSLFFFVSVFYQIKYGLGTKSPDTIVPFLAAIYATVAIYNFTQMLYKLSITCQAHRIFKTDPTRTIINFLIAWLVVCGIMTVCGALFYCSPVAKCWDTGLPGTCGNRSAMVYTWAAFNLLNDIIILVLPIPSLVRLQLDQKSRLVLLSLFACGFFTTLISVIRLKALYDSMSRAIADQPITGVNIALWSCIEINLAIITGSVPSIRPFFRRFLNDEPYRGSGGHEYDQQQIACAFARSPTSRKNHSHILFSGGPGAAAVAAAAAAAASGCGRLPDDDDDDDSEVLAYPHHARLKIQVEQSIEMSTMPMDDADSQSSRGLMGRVRSKDSCCHALGPLGIPGGGALSGSLGVGNITRIRGGTHKRDPDEYSPV